MDYQHISGVTKSINELTQAVTTPSEVSLTISYLDEIINVISNNHDMLWAALISGSLTAIAVAATAYFSHKSNQNLAKNHAEEVEVLKKTLNLQEKQFNADQLNIKNEKFISQRQEGYIKVLNSLKKADSKWDTAEGAEVDEILSEAHVCRAHIAIYSLPKDLEVKVLDYITLLNLYFKETEPLTATDPNMTDEDFSVIKIDFAKKIINAYGEIISTIRSDMNKYLT